MKAYVIGTLLKQFKETDLINKYSTLFCKIILDLLNKRIILIFAVFSQYF